MCLKYLSNVKIIQVHANLTVISNVSNLLSLHSLSKDQPLGCGVGTCCVPHQTGPPWAFTRDSGRVPKPQKQMSRNRGASKTLV